MEKPWVEIIDEPKQHDHRFRYKCEGNGAGSILGENSTGSVRTTPTIKIHNMAPNERAVIVVSCVNRSEPYYPHPHSLVGYNCKKGVCTIEVNGGNIVKLGNVGVQCCRQQDTKEALRSRKEINVDPFQTGHDVDIRQIDLSAVRLCFQVFLRDSNQKVTRVVTPVVTREIIDRRTVNKLEICRLSRHSAFSSGGEELFILCDKAKKGDVQVRFFEVLPDGSEWEAFGGSPEVHRQWAVTCTTPRYLRELMSGPASVWVQLFRPSDQMTGEPKPFQFIPNAPDEQSMLLAKRRKIEQRGFNITNSCTGVHLVEQPLLSHRQNPSAMGNGLALMNVVGAATPSGGYTGAHLTEQPLLSHRQNPSAVGNGLALMNVVGAATPSGGYTTLPPPYPGPANNFLEDNHKLLTDLIELLNTVPSALPGVNVAQTSQQQVKLMPRTTSEVDLGTVNPAQVNQRICMSSGVNIEDIYPNGQFVNFAPIGQHSGNQRLCTFSQAELGAANRLDSNQNQGIFTSNEEVNVDVARQHGALINVWTGQPGVNQTNSKRRLGQTNYVLDDDVGKLSNLDDPFPSGTVITITQPPVENQFQQDNH